MSSGAKRVEASRDQRLHGLRQVSAAGTGLAQHAHELLGVERIATGSLEESRLCLRRHDRPLEQRGDEARGVLVGQRRETDRRRVAPAATPAGSRVVELRSRRRDDHERGVRSPVEKVLHEVEQRGVRPVEVFEHENGRPIGGERLQVPPPGRERLLPADARDFVLRADERREPLRDPRSIGLVVDEVRDVSQLLEGLGRRVRLEDARLGLHDLAERPERDAVAVRQAPSLAPADEIRPAVDLLAELPDEPALSDAGLGDDGDELRRRLAQRTRERLAEQRELGVAADEERLGSKLGVHPEAAARRRRSPHRYRILLALRRNGLERLESDRALRRAHRRRVDDHRADRGCTLQARGGVDDVARDDSLASLGSRSQGDDRLTRGHCGAYGDVEAFAAQGSPSSRGFAMPRAPHAPRRPRVRRARRRPP